MALILDAPSEAVRQLSANDGEGRPILSVLAKRAYRMVGAEVVPEPELPALLDEPVFSDDDKLLEADGDLFPYKPLTDVVVKGACYNHGTRGPGAAQVGLAVGGHNRVLWVYGDRRAALGTTGTVVFSAPEPFERMPLTYAHAYGGRDEAAERREGFPWPGVFPDIVPEGEATPETASPWLYPRNPAGRGYVVEATREAVEAAALPNLEDPNDPLTPERFAVGDVLDWPKQPLPAGMDWMSYEWFPRCGCMGVVPAYNERPEPFPEVARGLMPQAIADPFAKTTESAMRFTCGASLGLQLPHLRGGEPLRLGNLSPRAPLEAWVVPRAPRVFTDARQGRLNPTETVLHTLIVEPDEQRMTVVWRGAAPALRHYLPDELKTMPLRVEWDD